MFVLLCCWGCVTPGSTGPESATATQEGAGGKPPVSPVKLDKGTVRLENVQVTDERDRTVIRMTADKPMQDYEFRRMGDKRFELNLGDVRSDGQPALPGGSNRVKISYGEQKPGVQIVGTHANHLDHYVMNRVENELIVALYFTKEATPREATAKAKPAAKAQRAPAAAATAAPSTDSVQAPEAETTAPVASLPEPPKTRAPAATRSAAATARRTPVPDAIPAAPTPIGGPKVYREKPISLDLLDADLKNVLRLIADITGTNIVIEPDVTGKVTLKVEQVPWDQVLDMVLSMNDLGMEKVGERHSSGQGRPAEEGDRQEGPKRWKRSRNSLPRRKR